MRLGIDIDTWKLTLCVSGPTVVMFEQAPLRSKGQSLFDAIQGVAPSLGLALNRLGLERGIEEVYIERGFGMFRKADFDLGAIYGATAVACRRLMPNVHIETVEVREWKRAVTAAVGITTKRGQPGNANANKVVANSSCRTLLLTRGLRDVEKLSADHLDAFGIVFSQEQPVAT